MQGLTPCQLAQGKSVMAMQHSMGLCPQQIQARINSPPRRRQWFNQFNSALQRVRHRVKRWWSNDPRNEQDLWELARSVERESPGLAAELRFIAMCRPIEQE